MIKSLRTAIRLDRACSEAVNQLVNSDIPLPRKRRDLHALIEHINLTISEQPQGVKRGLVLIGYYRRWRLGEWDALYDAAVMFILGGLVALKVAYDYGWLR